jgi:hypothetical protein
VGFLIVTRRYYFGLLAARHPAATNSGVEVNLHLFLEDHLFVVW